jgi:fermentation-respiration switch protein FrsA (DUF1100 family)
MSSGSRILEPGEFRNSRIQGLRWRDNGPAIQSGNRKVGQGLPLGAFRYLAKIPPFGRVSRVRQAGLYGQSRMKSPQFFCTRLGTAVLLAVSGCSVSGQHSPLLPIERSLVFQPAKYPTGDWAPPGLAFEDAWFTARDGTNLHGWYLAHPQPRGTALFCHGNAGHVADWSDALQALHVQHRLAVLSFDYRGYGRSEGEPSEEGILQDARAARKWLAEHTGTAEGDVILVGQSLGGAVAVDLASRDGARALVLARTFTSLPDVAARHVPWLLPRWNMAMKLDSLSKIGAYSGPVLISHGDADEVVPFAHGQALFDVAPGPKRFFRETGGGHNDAWSGAYHAALEEFLRSVDGATTVVADDPVPQTDRD